MGSRRDPRVTSSRWSQELGIPSRHGVVYTQWDRAVLHHSLVHGALLKHPSSSWEGRAVNHLFLASFGTAGPWLRLEACRCSSDRAATLCQLVALSCTLTFCCGDSNCPYGKVKLLLLVRSLVSTVLFGEGGQESSHPESKPLVLPRCSERQVLLSRASRRRSLQRRLLCKRRCSATAAPALADLAVVSSSKAWWKPGLQGMRWRGRLGGMVFLNKHQHKKKNPVPLRWVFLLFLYVAGLKLRGSLLIAQKETSCRKPINHC